MFCEAVPLDMILQTKAIFIEDSYDFTCECRNFILGEEGETDNACVSLRGEIRVVIVSVGVVHVAGAVRGSASKEELKRDGNVHTDGCVCHRDGMQVFLRRRCKR